jgi:hypothetical protein
MTQEPLSIHATYAERLAERREEIARRELEHRAMGYWRLAAALAAVLLVYLALVPRSLSVAWAAIPLAAFVALAVAHERVLRAIERRRRAARFYERGIARINGDWSGHGEQGLAYLEPAHPYAQDLDLFGKGSVFELICAARTHVGEEALARWLLYPAPPDTVRARQEAVEELRNRVDLREALAIAAEQAHTGVDPIALAAWGEAPAPAASRGVRLALWALSALGAAAVAAFLVFDAAQMGFVAMPAGAVAGLRDFFLIALAINGVFLLRNYRRAGAIAAAVDEAAHELRLLSEILTLLEREEFRSPMLRMLRASLDSEGAPPSRRLARLNRLTEYLDSRDHVLVRIAEPFLLWTMHLAHAVENWRRESGPAVRRWLTATGEIEALCSLAGYAFEHPADTFPEFAEGAAFEAEAIAHPLIPESRAVRNDVRLGGELRLFVVSGSNMSGKSTLLRTLGVNAVLAQAGAPVRAARLRLSPLAVGASIRITDSLESGVSRFYAEILRLRQILDLTGGSLPLLFLVDEFMHGTNSHDRQIGAAALVRGLVDRGAMGFITTHDLALAEIAVQMGPRAANVHFEDHLEDGRIRFDYIMRPGVVTKSNAIELMRSVGLEV